MYNHFENQKNYSKNTRAVNKQPLHKWSNNQALNFDDVKKSPNEKRAEKFVVEREFDGSMHRHVTTNDFVYTKKYKYQNNVYPTNPKPHFKYNGKYNSKYNNTGSSMLYNEPYSNNYRNRILKNNRNRHFNQLSNQPIRNYPNNFYNDEYTDYKPFNKHSPSYSDRKLKFQSTIQKFQKSPTKTAFASFNQLKNNFAKLPEVVLTNIYSYLDLEDCLSASTVCKSWRSGLLNSPSVWQKFPLVIYLCNKQADLVSAQFKQRNFSNSCQDLILKFDANDLVLIKKLTYILGTSSFFNLKSLSMQPIFNLYTEDKLREDQLIDYQIPEIDKIYDNKQENISSLSKKIVSSISEAITNSKSFEHLSLGFMNPKSTDISDNQLIKLLVALSNKHTKNLKSLHLSTCKRAKSTFISTKNIISKEIADQTTLTMNNLIIQFTNLQFLSIDFNQLTNQLIQSTLFQTTLKRLNLNVNDIATLSESQKLERNYLWLSTSAKNPQLRISVNFLITEDASRKYVCVLSKDMPLETIRMYFCKSFNPELIQFLSDNYSDTLKSLCVTDLILEPTLRYHNPLRLDADPDPLVLLCWKCKYLEQLVIVGYEMLEINLIAIAKLRTNLKLFIVAMDCIIDLKYGKFRADDDFIEDEDGDDTIVDYGSCSDYVIDKVCKVLNNPNWHPLEKEELPLCIYDFDIPNEEAYLDALTSEQQFHSQ